MDRVWTCWSTLILLSFIIRFGILHWCQRPINRQHLKRPKKLNLRRSHSLFPLIFVIFYRRTYSNWTLNRILQDKLKFNESKKFSQSQVLDWVKIQVWTNFKATKSSIFSIMLTNTFFFSRFIFYGRIFQRWLNWIFDFQTLIKCKRWCSIQYWEQLLVKMIRLTLIHHLWMIKEQILTKMSTLTFGFLNLQVV